MYQEIKTAHVRRRITKKLTQLIQLTVSNFARLRLGFEPDPLQSAVLDSSAKRGILNCTRQWGKSTILALKAAHRAYDIPGSLILVSSPSLRQSAEFLRKAAAFLAALGIPRRGDGDNPNSLALPNGSRIVALPGRSYRARLLGRLSVTHRRSLAPFRCHLLVAPPHDSRR